jgi:hypothetical protein
MTERRIYVWLPLAIAVRVLIGAAVGVAMTFLCAIHLIAYEDYDVMGAMPNWLPVTASAGGILGLVWGVVAAIALLWRKRPPSEAPGPLKRNGLR